MSEITLNEKQLEAVGELDRNILLLASAGTGKTNTVAHRIVNIIESKRADASQILCLTFTNRACKEMKTRIQMELESLSKSGQVLSTQVLDENKAVDENKATGENELDFEVNPQEVTVKTFDSFCFDVIRTHANKYTDIPSDFVVFDEEDSKEMMRDVLLSNHAGRITSKVAYNFMYMVKGVLIEYNCKEYQEAIDICADKKYDEFIKVCKGGRDYLEVGYEPENLLDHFVSKGALLIKKYNKHLLSSHALDFQDLTIYARRLLEDDSLAKQWQEKFSYIIVDEVQDTSLAQYDILSKLFAGNHIMMCGDEFQTIYKWRGSEPKKLLALYRKDYNPLEIVLNKNYRATQTLCDLSLAYLHSEFSSDNVGEESDKLDSEMPESVETRLNIPVDMEVFSKIKGEPVVFKEFTDLEKEAEWIFDKIKELHIKNYADVAILTRTNQINKQISDVFEERNSYLKEEGRVPFLLVDDMKFFRRQEIKDILAYMNWINNKYDARSLKKIILRFMSGVGEVTINEIEHHRKHGVSIVDFVNPLLYQNDFEEPLDHLMYQLNQGDVVVFDVESTGVNTTEDDVVQIAAIRINADGDELSVFERFLKPSKAVGASKSVHGFTDAFLNENGEDPLKVFTDFGAFIEDATLIGHNVGFDISIVGSQMERAQIEDCDLSAVTYYDTLDLARRFYPTLKNHKLETLSKMFDVTVKSDHNALNDIRATKEVLISILGEKAIPIREQRVAVYEKYKENFRQGASALNKLRVESETLRPYELAEEIIAISGIKKKYENDQRRLDNINYFVETMKQYDNAELSSRDALIDVLKLTALSGTGMDLLLEKKPRVPIITIHQAKGLEFKYVFVAGMNQHVFPSYFAVKDGNEQEEKRLFYVAITRAKEQLFVTAPEKVTLYGWKNCKGVSPYYQTLKILNDFSS